MFEQIYTYFTIEILYFWVNLGVLPFWLILIFIPQSNICRIFTTSVFPILLLSGAYVFMLYLIIQNNYASPDDILEIDARVKQKVTECEKFADESPYPEKNVMYDSVYEQKDYPFLKHKPE